MPLYISLASYSRHLISLFLRTLGASLSGRPRNAHTFLALSLGLVKYVDLNTSPP